VAGVADLFAREGARLLSELDLESGLVAQDDL
jgi:hypothetical protein